MKMMNIYIFLKNRHCSCNGYGSDMFIHQKQFCTMYISSVVMIFKKYR